MKQNLKYLATYLPWLLVLLAIDLFTAVLLWLSDIEKVSSLILLYLGFSPALFYPIISTYKKERKKQLLILDFHRQSKMDTGWRLLRLSSASRERSIEEIANALYQRRGGNKENSTHYSRVRGLC